MTALPDDYAPEKRTIKRVGIITNPESGNRSQEATAEAAAEFVRHGVNVTSATGLDPDSTREIASWMIRDRHIDAIVVSGGDGLIHHVLQSQAGTDVPMGIILRARATTLRTITGYHETRSKQLVLSPPEKHNTQILESTPPPKACASILQP